MALFQRFHDRHTRRSAGILHTLMIALLIGLSSSCSHQQQPLHELRLGDSPYFVDSGSRAAMLQALDRHLAYLGDRPETTVFRVGSQTLSRDMAIDSLQTFRRIVAEASDPIQLNRQIRDQFDIYRSNGRTADGRMLVTGYYEPVFPGSLNREGPYRYPLYSPPASLVHENDASGQRRTGRRAPDGTIIPYWTRAEIETRDIAAGNELAYLKDPLDAYLLHVQGSGRILLPDGTTRLLQFAATNDRIYHSLGKFFVDQNILARESVSIPAIRDYFASHPQEITTMLHHNPRYTFFRWGDETGPRGSLGVPLTSGRSVAIDHAVLPTGAVGYLVSTRPVSGDGHNIDHWRPFSLFVLPQDSGSAISGPGRIDVFWGAGPDAETAAGHMNQEGTLFFLIKKRTLGFASPSQIR